MHSNRSPNKKNKEDVDLELTLNSRKEGVKNMEKMMFEEFKEAVVEGIKAWLPEQFATAEVSLQVVRKNNNVALTALNIKCADNNICPVIYLEKFYEEYEEGEEFSEILSRIAQVRVEHDVKDGFDVSSITNFENVKDKILPRLINMEMNKLRLENLVHTEVADLAVTYHIVLNDDFDAVASVAVTNDILCYWEIDVEELHELAIANMKASQPGSCEGMSKVMADMMNMSEEEMSMMGLSPEHEQMYVLSNLHRSYGASVLLDEELMRTVIERVGGGHNEVYLLPSSVHEALVLSMDEVDLESLEDMVREVNDTQLKADELLSYHVYKYSMENGLMVA